MQVVITRRDEAGEAVPLPGMRAKLVIGLPGEIVEGRGGDVYVNGKRVDEPYLPAGVRTRTAQR